jgi:radical SAM superfamily enzyme YgiQ (UPF0313 family)
MKINLIEACPEEDKGSIGVFYVKHHLEKAGHIVELNNHTKKGYDIEMFSIHHCLDFLRLAKMQKLAPTRIVGGHPMQNNPLPVIPYSDAVFIGEAEGVIGDSISALAEDGIDALKNFPGWIISKYWRTKNKTPDTVICDPLPENPPYLNRPETRSAAWYVEIARGCPFKCHYCELGHSTKFRKYSFEQTKNTLDRCDLTKTRKINFYAPDEASHPDYKPLYDYLSQKGFLSGFSSMRLESVMKNNPPIKMNQLIRIGIDGLTEETRFRVNKKITDQMIIDYFSMLINNGHVQFKMFMIFGYSWEKLADFKGFEKLMYRILRIPLKKNISLRIKWTPFIPQPCTPLKNDISVYNHDMVEKILVWHAKNMRPRTDPCIPGIFIENDGLMSAKSHKLQCQLTKGDEKILYLHGTTKPLHLF